jgi:hypothetical protein
VSRPKTRVCGTDLRGTADWDTNWRANYRLDWIAAKEAEARP